MTDFEDRARSAGNALRGWTPGGDAPSSDTAVRRAVHRTRVHRATAGGLLVAVLGGVGLLWGPSNGDDVRLGPATTGSEDTTPTTDGPDPTTSTTAEPEEDESPGVGDPVATTTATTATPTTTEAPASPAPTSCTGQVRGTDITFEATLPAGWHHNEAALGEQACHYFGPEPIELRPVDTEADTGIASNAAVRLYVSQGSGGLPGSFDEAVDSADASNEVTSTRRTTVDGHAAARFEKVVGPGDDVPVGGEPYVRWTIDLGDHWFDATMTTQSGLSYEEAAAAIDQIVAGLDFSD